MPRINAPSVAEHVERQEQRILDEAIGLFVEHGYTEVSFGDIATRVGLARNSLYRYFSSKADILTRWFRTELDRRIERGRAFLTDTDDPRATLTAWCDAQLDYAARPEHALLMSMVQIEPELAVEARTELFGAHGRLMAPLRAVLDRIGVDATATAATAELVNALILGAARYEIVAGSPDPLVRDRMHRAIDALVDPG